MVGRAHSQCQSILYLSGQLQAGNVYITGSHRSEEFRASHQAACTAEVTTWRVKDSQGIWFWRPVRAWSQKPHRTVAIRLNSVGFWGVTWRISGLHTGGLRGIVTSFRSLSQQYLLVCKRLRKEGGCGRCGDKNTGAKVGGALYSCGLSCWSCHFDLALTKGSSAGMPQAKQPNKTGTQPPSCQQAA